MRIKYILTLRAFTALPKLCKSITFSLIFKFPAFIVFCRKLRYCEAMSREK